MRTKTLLLAAALTAAGLATSLAQSNVYSLNVVGYVNVNVAGNKFNMMSAPLNFTGAGGNNITNVVGGTIADNTLLYTFNGGGYDNPETYFAGFGWFPGTTTINPGTGFFLAAPSASTITFVGEVQQGSLTNPVPAGFSIRGSHVPQSVPIGDSSTSQTTTMHFPAVDNDLLYFWDTAGQTYKASVQYFNGYGWFDNGPSGPGPVEGPSPAVAEGFFVLNVGGATSWVRNFTIP